MRIHADAIATALAHITYLSTGRPGANGSGPAGFLPTASEPLAAPDARLCGNAAHDAMLVRLIWKRLPSDSDGNPHRDIVRTDPRLRIRRAPPRRRPTPPLH